jgi:hypothetical protein
MPNIPFNGGAILGNVELVTITWAGDPLEKALQSFDAWIPSSSYYTGSLAEYQVHAGKQVATWSIASPASASLDDSQVEQFLKDAVAAGHIPPPDGNRLYTIYPPAGTTVTIQGSPNCSYHNSANQYVYAIVSRCPSPIGLSDLEQLTLSSSHEIAESATDPFFEPSTGFGTAWFSKDPTLLSAFGGGEVGDLCLDHPITEDGHIVTALYSDDAARQEKRACVPAPPGPNFGATPSPQTAVGASGSTVTVQVTVFSEGPMPAPLDVTVLTFTPIAVAGAPSQAKNGDVFTLSIRLSEPPGPDSFYLRLSSSDGYSTLVPVLLTVQ